MISLFQQLITSSDPEHLCLMSEEALQHFPLHLFWKDKNGTYLGCSDGMARNLGLQKGTDMKGRTDFDLCWASDAPAFRLNDKKVMADKKAKVAIEKGRLVNGEESKALSFKYPLQLRSKKTPGGIICLAIQFDQDAIFPHLLNEISTTHPISSNHLSSVDSIAAYNLTKRQKECLFYLSRGMTIKQIANKLALSPRTVEHYLDVVKDKLGCHSKSQLIAKMIEE